MFLHSFPMFKIYRGHSLQPFEFCLKNKLYLKCMNSSIMYDTTRSFLPVKNDILPPMNIIPRINVYDIYWFYDQYNIETKTLYRQHKLPYIQESLFTFVTIYFLSTGCQESDYSCEASECWVLVRKHDEVNSGGFVHF